MAEYTSPEHHPAFEEYCETIFELNEDGQRVIQARIAERLEVSRPAVSEMVRRLVDEGLVYVESHEIKLTEDGKVLATTMVRRHRLAERFLTDMLGLSWAEAHHEAEEDRGEEEGEEGHREEGREEGREEALRRLPFQDRCPAPRHRARPGLSRLA